MAQLDRARPSFRYTELSSNLFQGRHSAGLGQAARSLSRPSRKPWRAVADRTGPSAAFETLALDGDERVFQPCGRKVVENDLLDRLASLADRYGLAGRFEAFTARHEGPTADVDWAARHWDLRATDEAYAAFVAEWRPRLERERGAAAGGEALADAMCFVERTRLVHAFRKFLFIDPGLPQELLPERWAGTGARAVFSAYYHLLTEGALRFFEHNYRPAPGHEGDLPRGRPAARRDPVRPPVPVV